MATATVYVMLAAKPGVFHTEIGPDVQPVESYDYVCQGRIHGHFVIARLERETRMVVVDEGEPSTFSQVPSKLLKKYASVEAARGELEQLTKSQLADVRLVRVAI